MTHYIRRRSWCQPRGLVLGLLSLLSSGGAVIAAGAPTPALDEVVVTVRRRSEALQSTPMSVVSWSRDALQWRDVTRVSEVDRFTPNLLFDTTAPISGSSNAATVFIRGVGQSDYLFTQDPGVGIYLGDVYLSRGIGSVLDTVDVDRIEVVRGPQGTLYGRNTIGGVIRLVPAAPTDGFGGALGVAAGDRDRRDVTAVFNVPLGERVRTRVAAAHRRRDGYVRRLLTGEQLGDQDNATVRGQLSWRATDALQMDVAADWFGGQETGSPSALRAFYPAEIGAPGTIFAGTYNATLSFHGGEPYDSRWLTSGLDANYGTAPSRSEFNVAGMAVTLRWQPSARAQLRSVSAWRRLDTDMARDPDNSPTLNVHTGNNMEHRQISQEFLLLGESPGGGVEWSGGLFYIDENASDRNQALFISDTFGAPAAGTFWESQGFTSVPPLDIGGPRSSIDSTSAAAHVRGSFAITDALRISAGVRYTHDEKRVLIPTRLTQVGVPLLQDPAASRRFDDWSVQAGIDQKLPRGILLYLSYADGYKSGGFNQRYSIPIAAPTSFAPETLGTWELGAKAGLWQERLQLSAAAFHSDYDDIQVTVFDAGVPRILNAAAGRIRGVELEAALRPTEGLQLWVALGHMDATYERLAPFVIGSFGVPVVNPLSLDDRFVNTPANALSAGLEQSWSLGNGASLAAMANASHRSTWANDAINTPELMEGGVTLIDASLRYAWDAGRWSVALKGTNLTDEIYVASGVADKAGFGIAEVMMGEPRSLGLAVEFRF